MSEPVANGAAAEANGPTFSVEKIYVKDVSFEAPGVPHPRNYSTNVRVLGYYVREQHVLTLEDAVRKMTSQAAIRVGLTDRGIVRPGMAADLVVFDAATVKDLATFAEPNQYSAGVRHVFVNGTAVVSNGAITSARPGQPLRGPGYRPAR
mgnify:CR=1 FL=1